MVLHYTAYCAVFVLGILNRFGYGTTTYHCLNRNISQWCWFRSWYGNVSNCGSIGVPTEGYFNFGVDRLLDMLRTVVNVTGDLTVAIYASSEGQLRKVHKRVNELMKIITFILSFFLCFSFYTK